MEHGKNNDRTDTRNDPNKSQPRNLTQQPRGEDRQDRAVPPPRSQNAKRHQIRIEPWSPFEYAKPPLDPHESLGADPGEFTEEQEFALFNLMISMYAQREKIAELVLNMTRRQFEFDNKKAALKKRNSREQQDAS
jgi:hypothetical protein